MQDLTWLTQEVDNVLTLFSGGLDSTYVLDTLKDKGVKVTALAVDVGDGIDYARLKSLVDHYKVNLKVIDGKRDLVYEGVLPAIQG
jgi:argininosuccinate synthase